MADRHPYRSGCWLACSSLSGCHAEPPRLPEYAQNPAICSKPFPRLYQCGHTAGVDEIELV